MLLFTVIIFITFSFFARDLSGSLLRPRGQSQRSLNVRFLLYRYSFWTPKFFIFKSLPYYLDTLLGSTNSAGRKGRNGR